MTEINGGRGNNNPSAESSFDRGGNTSSPLIALQTAIEEPWTKNRMLNASPCDIIEIDEEALSQAAEELARGAQPGTIEGGIPQYDTVDIDPQATSGGYNYPAPYTSFEVFDDYRVYPYRCIGKIFFTRNGGDYVCSGSSIGNNAIWSAGHCLHAGNNSPDGWSTDVIFVPAYKDGDAPYGQWRAKQLSVRTAWFKDGNPNGLYQDMGGAILHPLNNKKISEVVGWLGFSWNRGKYQHWNQLGYPAGAPFDGQKLIQNSSSYAYDGNVAGTPKPVGVGSNLTGGSSGGPWIVGFGSKNYLNGCNSYHRTSNPEEMFSPYFNENAKSLLDRLISD